MCQVLKLTHFLHHLGLFSEEQFAAVELAVVHADEEWEFFVSIGCNQRPFQQAPKHI